MSTSWNDWAPNQWSSFWIHNFVYDSFDEIFVNLNLVHMIWILDRENTSGSYLTNSQAHGRLYVPLKMQPQHSLSNPICWIRLNFTVTSPKTYVDTYPINLLYLLGLKASLVIFKFFFKWRFSFTMLQDGDIMNCIPTQAEVSYTASQYFLQTLVSRLNIYKNDVNNIIKHLTKTTI